MFLVRSVSNTPLSAMEQDQIPSTSQASSDDKPGLSSKAQAPKPRPITAARRSNNRVYARRHRVKTKATIQSLQNQVKDLTSRNEMLAKNFSFLLDLIGVYGFITATCPGCSRSMTTVTLLGGQPDAFNSAGERNPPVTTASTA